LLELAHLLGKASPARPVELVACTLEEPPHFRTRHMGSVWLASALRAAGVMAMVVQAVYPVATRPGT